MASFRRDTVELQGPPTNFLRVFCDPKRTCHAFVSEFRGSHSHRLQMCGATAANKEWPRIFGTAPCFAEAPELFPKLLVFRVWVTCIFASHWIVHLLKEWHDGYWLMYLTHWSLTVELLYFAFSVYTTHEARNLLISQTALPPSAFESWVHLPWFVKATWGLYHVALPASLLVFLLYWTLVSPFWKLKAVPDYMDVFIHGINFGLCLLDTSLSRIVYYAKYCVLFFIYAFIYILFSVLHFFLEIGRYTGCKKYAGEKHKCPIYDPLDWHEATATGILSFIILVCIVPLCQIPLWRLVMCRRRVDLYWTSGGRSDLAQGMSQVELNRTPAHSNSVRSNERTPGESWLRGVGDNWGAPPPTGDQGADMEKAMKKEGSTIEW